MCASKLVLNELGRSHPGNLKLTGMLEYADGILAMFNHSWDSEKPQYRVAFLQYWSIETTNDALVIKWDVIAK